MGRDLGGIDDFESDDSEPHDLMDPSGADSPAPVPPHERIWRHPSEIGFAAMASIDDEIDIGRNGRRLVGIASVVTMTLVVALAVALQPGSLRSNPDDVLALTNSRLRIASFDYPERTPDRVVEPDGGAEPRIESGSAAADDAAIGSNLAEVMGALGDAMSAVSRPAETTTTIAAQVNTPARAMGVLSESGEHLLTTMAAVANIESIDVRLPNGQMVRSRILYTLPELHIAVLSVTDEETTGARADIKASGLSTEGEDHSIGQPVIVLVDSPLEFVIGKELDGVLVSLESYSSNTVDTSIVAEGSPVVGKTGHLIGLCTHAGGRLGFVPVRLLETALSTMLSGGGATTMPPPQ